MGVLPSSLSRKDIEILSGALVFPVARDLQTKNADFPKILDPTVKAVYVINPTVSIKQISGTLRVLDLTNPAAGAEYASQTVPANKQWRVIGWQGAITTSATAANRIPNLTYSDGTNIFLRVGMGGRAQASQTAAQFSMYIGATENFTNETLNSERIPSAVSALPNMVLDSGYVVAFSTSGLQAGDDWAQGYMIVEEFTK